MRLWSLHPRYLDAKGLLALWREGLLAQAVLAGKTRGYRHHPQLQRFQAVGSSTQQIGRYLEVVWEEANRRGYRFDGTKLPALAAEDRAALPPIAVTEGQLLYERAHLLQKLTQRAPVWLVHQPLPERPEIHPSFLLGPGGIAPWEVVTKPEAGSGKRTASNRPSGGRRG